LRNSRRSPEGKKTSADYRTTPSNSQLSLLSEKSIARKNGVKPEPPKRSDRGP